MKKTVMLAVLVLIFSAWAILHADEKPGDNRPRDNPPETLLGVKDYTVTGYGAPFYRFSKAGEKFGDFAGVRGGFIINSNLVIGASMSGLVYPQRREDISGIDYTGPNPNVHMRYGGGLMEYYFTPKSLFSLSIGTLIGGGGVMIPGWMHNNNSSGTMRNDRFFAMEPEINVFVNITRFFRAGIGGSYRYVRGINRYDLTDKDFRGPAGSVILAFGWF